MFSQTNVLLHRCVFFGQHPVAGLLELPDAALKEELSAVVPLNAWADANALAKALLKVSLYHTYISAELTDFVAVIV
jgi:hypothetical protein